MKILTRDRTFYRSLLLLSIPIALQNLVTFGVGLADNLMIGALGDTAVSGVYMANQIQTLLQVFSGGVEGAILILCAQYWGRGDTASICRVVSIGVRLCLLFGLSVGLICFFAPVPVLSLFTREDAVIREGAQYLRILCFSFPFFCLTQSLIAAARSVENAKLGLMVCSLSLCINVVLNYLLIFGKFGFPALGVRGAAIATLIARVAECAVTTVCLLCTQRRLGMRASDFVHTDRALLRDFFRYGTPIMLGQLVWAVNMLAGSAIMGRFPRAVITAVSMTGTLGNLAYVVMNGMAGALGILTGKTIGASQEQKMREYARTVQVLFALLGIITGGALFALRLPYLSLYAVSEQALACARQLTLVIAVCTVGTCYQCACLFGLVKSGGDTSFVFKNDAFFVFAVVLPCAYISYRLGAPPWVVFSCLKSDQILKCFVAAVKINRFDWMKNLTRDANSC